MTSNFQVEDDHTYYVSGTGVLVHNECPQRLVAGDKKGWNARVSEGGFQDHAPPHAHVYFKNNKIASVDLSGKITKGIENLGKKGINFVRDNKDLIINGIKTWWP